LKALGGIIEPSYASRDAAKAAAFSARYGGACSYSDYAAALADPKVDAVVIAVPPYLHLDLTLQALAAGKHVLVEKPAFPTMDEYRAAVDARNRARRVVLIGENDHYKPLAVRLRTLLADGVIGELVFGHFTTIARRLKTADDWRNDEKLAGGDAFFEEGIHWLHLAGSLGPRIVKAHGYRPTPSREGPDRRVKSMMVAFEYDTGAVGSLYYSREVPSLLRGLRLSKLYGRNGVISFESNGSIMVVRGNGVSPRHSHRSRARDEPRARDGRSTSDGSDLRDPRAGRIHGGCAVDADRALRHRHHRERSRRGNDGPRAGWHRRARAGRRTR
jgi:predicted dehydrogenase